MDPRDIAYLLDELLLDDLDRILLLRRRLQGTPHRPIGPLAHLRLQLEVSYVLEGFGLGLPLRGQTLWNQLSLYRCGSDLSS